MNKTKTRRKRMSLVDHVFYKLDRERNLEKQNNRCVYCGEKITRSEATVDHVIPISKVKYHSVKNTVAACHDCNQRKANKDTIEFTDFELRLQELDRKLEERIQLAEYRLSFKTYGSFNKWKKYQNKHKQ